MTNDKDEQRSARMRMMQQDLSYGLDMRRRGKISIEHYYHKELIRKIPVDREGHTRGVCPECHQHPQGLDDDVLDCKNLFYELGFTVDGMPMKEITGQCCCWSSVHGTRT